MLFVEPSVPCTSTLIAALPEFILFYNIQLLKGGTLVKAFFGGRFLSTATLIKYTSYSMNHK